MAQLKATDLLYQRGMDDCEVRRPQAGEMPATDQYHLGAVEMILLYKHS